MILFSNLLFIACFWCAYHSAYEHDRIRNCHPAVKQYKRVFINSRFRWLFYFEGPKKRKVVLCAFWSQLCTLFGGFAHIILMLFYFFLPELPVPPRFGHVPQQTYVAALIMVNMCVFAFLGGVVDMYEGVASIARRFKR